MPFLFLQAKPENMVVKVPSPEEAGAPSLEARKRKNLAKELTDKLSGDPEISDESATSGSDEDDDPAKPKVPPRSDSRDSLTSIPSVHSTQSEGFYASRQQHHVMSPRAGSLDRGTQSMIARSLLRSFDSDEQASGFLLDALPVMKRASNE